ncbi:hypothetical protein [Primorskyibacter sp. 2E233]|uniref:hypothetical protein n=1 Tax=Primorskyibacter sp. 2E233 TaxID=3413431 RepID=UPI003BF2E181
MTLKSYSEDHQKIITNAIRTVGLNISDIEGKSYGPQSHKGAMVISSDPGQDNLNSRLVNVNSIAELKAIGGIADSHFESAGDKHVDYPEDALKTDVGAAIERARLDSCSLESLLHPDDHAVVDQAMMAYLNGNSAKVKDFEPVINALRFPMQILVTAGEDITVTKDNPLIIGQDSPHVQGGKAIFGTVTVEEGGQIQILIPVTFEAAQMILK